MGRPSRTNVIPLVRPRTVEPSRDAREGKDRGAPPVESALDDFQLLAALRAGDADAATSLYRRARPHVERTVRRLIGSGDPEHDDLVQNAIIAFVGSVHRFRGESSLDTWITRITANTVFKAIRHRKTERRTLETSVERLPAPPREGASSMLESRDILDRLRALLATMDPVKSFAVLLHDVLGYDLREVAEITEASIAAAQTRLVRGRAELHERIASDPELAELLDASANANNTSDKTRSR